MISTRHRTSTIRRYSRLELAARDLLEMTTSMADSMIDYGVVQAKGNNPPTQCDALNTTPHCRFPPPKDDAPAGVKSSPALQPVTWDHYGAGH